MLTESNEIQKSADVLDTIFNNVEMLAWNELNEYNKIVDYAIIMHGICVRSATTNQIITWKGKSFVNSEYKQYYCLTGVHASEYKNDDGIAIECAKLFKHFVRQGSDAVNNLMMKGSALSTVGTVYPYHDDLLILSSIIFTDDIMREFTDNFMREAFECMSISDVKKISAEGELIDKAMLVEVKNAQ